MSLMTPAIDPDRLRRALRWARSRMTACDLCAEGCGVDRTASPSGRCGLGEDAYIYKEYLHLGEERELLPSHTVYLSGCNFRCVFCSDLGPVTRPTAHGVVLDPDVLAQRIAKRRKEGSRNVNFVGGVPDVNLVPILETLTRIPIDTHIVWNTNLWTTETAIEHLTGVVGTWLVDLKFGNDRCALKLAGAKGYTGRLHPLIRALEGSGDTLIRHLVMPGHLECCTAPALSWLAEHARHATVNLMTGYHPFQLTGRATPLGRRLGPEERAQALALFDSMDGQIKGQMDKIGRPKRLLDGVEYAPDAPG